jgi:hypothetical protein
MKFLGNYFERRREEAKQTLQKLRDFYDVGGMNSRFFTYPLDLVSHKKEIEELRKLHVEGLDLYLEDYRTRRLVHYKVLDRTGEEDPIRSLGRIRRNIKKRSLLSLKETLEVITRRSA